MLASNKLGQYKQYKNIYSTIKSTNQPNINDGQPEITKGRICDKLTNLLAGTHKEKAIEIIKQLVDFKQSRSDNNKVKQNECFIEIEKQLSLIQDKNKPSVDELMYLVKHESILFKIGLPKTFHTFLQKLSPETKQAIISKYNYGLLKKEDIFKEKANHINYITRPCTSGKSKTKKPLTEVEIKLDELYVKEKDKSKINDDNYSDIHNVVSSELNKQKSQFSKDEIIDSLVLSPENKEKLKKVDITPEELNFACELHHEISVVKKLIEYNSGHFETVEYLKNTLKSESMDHKLLDLREKINKYYRPNNEPNNPSIEDVDKLLTNNEKNKILEFNDQDPKDDTSSISSELYINFSAKIGFKKEANDNSKIILVNPLILYMNAVEATSISIIEEDADRNKQMHGFFLMDFLRAQELFNEKSAEIPTAFKKILDKYRTLNIVNNVGTGRNKSAIM